MKSVSLPTLTDLRRRFYYDSESGVIRWRISPANNTRSGTIIRPNVKTYRQVTIKGKAYLLHRVIWKLFYGTEPKNGMSIDHINGDITDNRISNLRLATHSQNMKNKKKSRTSKSPHKWVYKSPKRNWEIRIAGFDTAEEAFKAACMVNERFFGEFGRTE